MRKSKPYDDLLMRDLQDDEFAVDFLNLSLEEDGVDGFLRALDAVMKARKISGEQISRKANLSKRTVYHSLSDQGNPTLKTIYPLIQALGFQISLKRHA